MCFEFGLELDEIVSRIVMNTTQVTHCAVWRCRLMGWCHAVELELELRSYKPQNAAEKWIYVLEI